MGIRFQHPGDPVTTKKVLVVHMEDLGTNDETNIVLTMKARLSNTFLKK